MKKEVFMNNSPYSLALLNVTGDRRSIVYVRARNSAGFSPFGRCNTVPGEEPISKSLMKVLTLMMPRFQPHDNRTFP